MRLFGLASGPALLFVGSLLVTAVLAVNGCDGTIESAAAASGWGSGHSGGGGAASSAATGHVGGGGSAPMTTVYCSLWAGPLDSGNALDQCPPGLICSRPPASSLYRCCMADDSPESVCPPE